MSWDIQGAVCSYSEKCIPNDVVNALTEVYSLVAFPVFIFIMHDFSATTGLVDEIAAAVAFGANKLSSKDPNHKLRTAIVSQNSKFDDALLYFKERHRLKFEIFDNSADANAWARRDITKY